VNRPPKTLFQKNPKFEKSKRHLTENPEPVWLLFGQNFSKIRFWSKVGVAVGFRVHFA